MSSGFNTIWSKNEFENMDVSEIEQIAKSAGIKMIQINDNSDLPREFGEITFMELDSCVIL